MDTQELVKFENGEVSLNVPVGADNDTVWLTQEDMAMLFEKNKSTISRHIRNIFEEGELEEISSIAKNATQLKKYDPRTGKDRLSDVEIIFYNLDVIISVGYRVKSKQGIILTYIVNIWGIITRTIWRKCWNVSACLKTLTKKYHNIL